MLFHRERRPVSLSFGTSGPLCSGHSIQPAVLARVSSLVGALKPRGPKASTDDGRLIAHDRSDEAVAILKRLHTNGGRLSIGEAELNREAAEIKATVDEEREAAAGSSFKALLKDGSQKFRYRTLLGIGGQFMQQLSGKPGSIR